MRYIWHRLQRFSRVLRTKTLVPTLRVGTRVERLPGSEKAVHETKNLFTGGLEAPTSPIECDAVENRCNLKPPNAKPLRGFGGGSVLEVVEDHDRGTYRAVFTVKFQGTVYVLHVFQKKSKKGIETPKSDVDLIKARLKAAADDHEQEQERGLASHE